MRNILLIFLYLFSSVSTYCANPGDLDVTYNAAGSQPGTNVVPVPGAIATGVYDNTIQSDQKCVVVGDVNNGAHANIMLSRFNTDGTLDSATFNASDPTHPGIVVTDLTALSVAYGVKLQSNQSIVIAGFTTAQPTVPTSNPENLIVARYDSSGVLDPSFGNNPFGGSYAGITTVDVGADARANSLAIENGTNAIVVAGQSDSNIVMAKFDSNGLLDTSFGGGTGFVITTPADIGGIVEELAATDIKINPIDNKIILCGFTGTPSLPQAFVARYNSDGTLDTTFNSAGAAPGFAFLSSLANHHVLSVVIQNDQKIVLGCTTEIVDAAMALVRFNVNGTLDTTYGTGGIVTTQSNGVHTEISKIAIQSNQKIVAVGFNTDEVNFNLVLARFNTDGTLDSTFIDSSTSTPAGTVATIFNGGTSQLGKAVSIQDDQKIVVAGDRTTSNEILIARYLADTTFITITAPTENQVLNNARPTITGTMEVGNTIVQVSIDGGSLQNAIVNSNAGTWTFTPASKLSQGSHTVQAFTTDPLGNTAQTVVINFIINTTTFVTITSPTQSEVINNAQPTITGTMEVGNTIVQVSIDGGALQNATVNSATGTWSFTTGLLSNGSHTVQAFTTNPVGNTATSSIITFTVNLNAGTFVVIISPANGSTTTNIPLLRGTTAPGNTVQIIIDGVSVGFAKVNFAGIWSFQITSPLSNGIHSIQAIATNTSGDTASVTINITVAAASCVLPADQLTLALRNKYGQ